jgi:hypothetical protein
MQASIGDRQMGARGLIVERIDDRRKLTRPDNLTGDDDGDGYSNLEQWLHVLAADVEGRSR